MSNFNGFQERFNSSEDEETNWNKDAYDDGFNACLDGRSILDCPAFDKLSRFNVRSWNAGWIEADCEKKEQVEAAKQIMEVQQETHPAKSAKSSAP